MLKKKLLILLFCFISFLPAAGSALAGSGTFRGEWYSYYDRGLEYADKSSRDNIEKAISDLEEAVSMRSKDQRTARTYGMHFIEYFPHRELGIIYFGMGEMEKALAELQTSISHEESAKAVFYLNKTRQAILQRQAARPASPPVITIESPMPDAVVKELTVKVKGKVTGEGFVSSVTINKVPHRFEKALEEIRFERDITVDDGSNVLTVTAKDLMGNAVEKTLTIAVKREGPTISVSDLSPQERNGVIFIRVRGDIGDAAGISKVLIDGKEVVSAGKAKTYKFDMPIERKPVRDRFIIQAFDIIGNETTAEVSLQVVEQALAAKHSAEKEAAKKAEQERISLERAEAQRLAREKAAAEETERRRLAKEAAEQTERRVKELIEQERAAKDRETAARAKKERIEREKAEAERLARERAEAEQAAAYKEASEKLLTTALAAEPVKEQATVTVVEREKIKEVIEEQKLSDALAADKLKLGKIVGGEGTRVYEEPQVTASKTPAVIPPPSAAAVKAPEDEELPEKCKGLLAFDREKPILNLRGTTDIPDVFVDRYPVEGEAFDNCRIDRIVINEKELPVRKGRKLFFSKNIKLEKGQNRIVVDVYDHSGNKTTSEFSVTRNIPSVMQTASRMSMLVLPFDIKDSPAAAAAIASDYLMGSFVDQKRFTLVDRQKLKQLLDEQKFTQAMLKEVKEMIRLGKLTAAETILATTIKENQKSVEVVSRVINTETSEIMDIKDGYTEDKSPLAVKELMDALASKIAGGFPLVEGLVIDRDNKEVVTDLSIATRIKRNMGAIIYRKGKERIHPVTGKSLGSDTVRLGEGYIEDIQEGFSKVRLTDKARQQEINVKDFIMTK